MLAVANVLKISGDLGFPAPGRALRHVTTEVKVESGSRKVPVSPIGFEVWAW